MKRRMGLVEDRPQVTKSLVLPSVAHSGSAASEVRGRQQRPALHGLEYPLRLRHDRLDVCLRSTNRGDKRADQLASEPILRLAGVERPAGSFRGGRRGHAPLAGVQRGPREVDQRLRERTEPDLLAQPSTAWARNRAPPEKSPSFSAAIPTSMAATGSST